ncbi:MAG: hypothetical protein ACM338_15455 [Betaproteobacteria bacterium]
MPDIQIAQQATFNRIAGIAQERPDIDDETVEPAGRFEAKRQRMESHRPRGARQGHLAGRRCGGGEMA